LTRDVEPRRQSSTGGYFADSPGAEKLSADEKTCVYIAAETDCRRALFERTGLALAVL
jgi:hypothetical protein